MLKTVKSCINFRKGQGKSLKSWNKNQILTNTRSKKWPRQFKPTNVKRLQINLIFIFKVSANQLKEINPVSQAYGMSTRRLSWMMWHWTLWMMMKWWKIQKEKLSWSGIKPRKSIHCKRLTEKDVLWVVQEMKLVLKLRRMKNRLMYTNVGSKKLIFHFRNLANWKIKSWLIRRAVQMKQEV